MSFWGWWGCLDWRVRIGSAILVLILACVLAVGVRVSDPARSPRSKIAANPDAPPPTRDYRGPILLGAVGFVMLVFSGRSKAEKLGYQDF